MSLSESAASEISRVRVDEIPETQGMDVRPAQVCAFGLRRSLVLPAALWVAQKRRRDGLRVGASHREAWRRWRRGALFGNTVVDLFKIEGTSMATSGDTPSPYVCTCVSTPFWPVSGPSDDAATRDRHLPGINVRLYADDAPLYLSRRQSRQSHFRLVLKSLSCCCVCSGLG